MINPWDSYKKSLLDSDKFIHLKNGKKINEIIQSTIIDGGSKYHLYKHKTISTIFENTYKHTNDIFDISFQILHYMMPNLIAFDLIGVQALKNDVDDIENLVLRTISDNRLSINISKNKVTSETKSYFDYDKSIDELIKLIAENMVANDELIKLIAENMVANVDSELIDKLMSISDEADLTFDMNNFTDKTIFVGDAHAALAILINRQANRIAANTRRGAGNWCVVSPTALTILQSSTIDSFARSDDEENKKRWDSGINHIGKLNNRMDVYCNPYASDNVPVLVGYKGNDIDAGLFYCPYLPFYIEDNVIKSKHAFVGIGTEDGDKVVSSKASDYYKKVGIEASSLRFF